MVETLRNLVRRVPQSWFQGQAVGFLNGGDESGQFLGVVVSLVDHSMCMSRHDFTRDLWVLDKKLGKKIG